MPGRSREYVAQALGVVARRHQECTGGVGAHTVASDELGSGGGDEGLQDGLQIR
jgi:hypothetical protein